MGVNAVKLFTIFENLLKISEEPEHSLELDHATPKMQQNVQKKYLIVSTEIKRVSSRVNDCS